MIGFLAGLSLAAANVCLYSSFAIPHAARFERWLNPALLSGGVAAFLIAPLLLGDRWISLRRAWRKDVNGPRVLLSSLLAWNLTAVSAFCALTPREQIVQRAEWLPKRLRGTPTADPAATPAAESATASRWSLRSLIGGVDPAQARDVVPVVIRGRLAAGFFVSDYLGEEFVESHGEAAASESALAVYALSTGLLVGNGLKSLFDEKEASGIDQKLDGLGAELRVFKTRWKDEIEGRKAGGRPFLRESLVLFKSMADALDSGSEPEAKAQSRRQVDELTATILKGVSYESEAEGRVRVDLKPSEQSAYPIGMPGMLRLLHEDGRWRVDAQLALDEKDLMRLIKEVRKASHH